MPFLNIAGIDAYLFSLLFLTRQMAPFIDALDFVLTEYFDKHFKYTQIKQLKLPMWYLLLVAIFVILVLYWFVLIVNGIKHLVDRYAIGGARTQNTGHSDESIPQRIINRSTADCGDFYETSSIWVHINAREPTH